MEGLQTVIQPLASLKDAVDHTGTGNYEIGFESHGGGELVELAKSIQNLTSSLWRQQYDRGQLETLQSQKEEKVRHETQELSR